MSLTDQFTRELVDAMPDTRSRLICLSVLAKWAGASLYLPMPPKANRRARVAANMIANGTTCAAVRTIIRERFNVSDRTAWRDVILAGQMSRKNDIDCPETVVSIPTFKET